jgi:hypothetical protein
MARFSKLEVLTTMEATGLIPVFYNKDFEVAMEIVNACIRGGAKIVEFTNRGDYAYQVFGKLSRHFSESDQDVILGVGSVIDYFRGRFGYRSLYCGAIHQQWRQFYRGTGLESGSCQNLQPTAGSLFARMRHRQRNFTGQRNRM